MDKAHLHDLSKPMREMRKPFLELVEPHRQRLWKYCLRLTGSPWDAEDLFQETMAKAFSRLAFFWQPLEARPYLFRIASNAWIDEVCRHRTVPEDLEELPQPCLAEPDQAEVREAMETLIGLLPPRQRVAVLLVDVFDFTAAEVGAMLGLTEGAVRAVLHRARTTLRTQGPAVPGWEPQRLSVQARHVVDRFIDAFNRRDPEGIVALMDVGASAENLGVGEEYGRDEMARNSIKDARFPEPFEGALALLWGREVVCFYFRTHQHERALGWVVDLDFSEDRITHMKGYWFTPEFLEAAAAELGVPSYTHGYSI